MTKSNTCTEWLQPESSGPAPAEPANRTVRGETGIGRRPGLGARLCCATHRSPSGVGAGVFADRDSANWLTLSTDLLDPHQIK